MKTILLYAIITMYVTQLLSCANTTGTTKDSAAIKLEIKQTMGNLFHYSSTANLDSTLIYFDSSADFRAMDDGKLYNYNGFMQLGKETMNAIKKQDFKVKTEEIILLNDSLAHYIVAASDDITNNDNSVTHLPDYAGSFLLKNINGNWKVIFMHESVPPAPAADSTQAQKK